jgi:hypothetical protein
MNTTENQSKIENNGADDISSHQTDVALELYKFEYEKGAERYENIYKAIWTNFSYMAIVSGAILTFSGTKFSVASSSVLACLPLYFWYFATYIPLNRYGDQVRDRLCDIERLINSKYCNEFGQGDHNGSTTTGLKHFTHYKDKKLKFFQLWTKENKWPIFKFELRVRWTVHISAALLFLFIIFNVFIGSKYWDQLPNEKRMEVESKGNSFQIKTSGISLDNFGKIVSQSELSFTVVDGNGEKKIYSLVSGKPLDNTKQIESDKTSDSLKKTDQGAIKVEKQN